VKPGDRVVLLAACVCLAVVWLALLYLALHSAL